MKDNIFVKLLGVLGINVAMGVVYWLIVQYVLAVQDNLSPTVLERIQDNPARLETYLGEASGSMLQAGIISLLLGAILAGLWLVLVMRNPPGGPESARAKRPSWAGLLLLLVISAIACFWFALIGAAIAQTLASKVSIYAAIVGTVLTALGYWLATAACVPDTTKVAVPLSRLLRR